MRPKQSLRTVMLRWWLQLEASRGARPTCMRHHMLLRKHTRISSSPFPQSTGYLLWVCTQPGTNTLIPALRSFQTKAEVPMLSRSLLAYAEPHTGPQLRIQKELLCAQRGASGKSKQWTEGTNEAWHWDALQIYVRTPQWYLSQFLLPRSQRTCSIRIPESLI